MKKLYKIEVYEFGPDEDYNEFSRKMVGKGWGILDERALLDFSDQKYPAGEVIGWIVEYRKDF